MPIYAYRCDSCGFGKDVLQKMSDAPLTQCPECGKDTFRKQVTAAGFQLKGSGWYVTDFRGGSNSANGNSNGSNGKSSGDGAAASADSGKSASGSGDSAASSGSGSSSASSSSAPATPAASGSTTTGSA
ncbi:FmdB family zinc ribbon protein [Paraburkholderia phosphatilytica]|uniref:FmdB family zinc ribbon protein n=1 Tax=Paraburkholderia phosphatilytica TaxID=2282883 RepID=UPI000E4DC16B|nr:FmdB family zinc ribbon protein [Paraburkholderia phosphatilytica]